MPLEHPDFSLIEKYFPKLTAEQKVQFQKLETAYKDWNLKVNVVSRKDVDLLYERHVLHSLGIAKVIRFKPGTHVLDVGTGGGFPGIPLAILFPKSRFHLVDSIGKKIKVVESVIETLELTNVKAMWTRVEELKGTYDFAVSRAVAPLPTLWDWVGAKIRPNGFNDLPNGMLCLKGGDLTEERKGLRKSIFEYPISDYFEEPFFETKKVVSVKR